MLQLDHFAMFSHNHYQSTFDLSRQTGLGNYDGGFFPNYGLGIKVVPLGPDLFLEIESVIDYGLMRQMLAPDSGAADERIVSRKFLAHMLRKPEAFVGWCFRTDSLEELEELGRAAGFKVDHEALNLENSQQMMNGNRNVVVSCPNGGASWPLGMPNVYYWPDMTRHDARHPVIEGSGTRKPLGLEWIEVGGTAAEFEQWFGGFTQATDHPLRFNGKAHGLYAIAVNTDQGQVVIRRPSLNE